MLNITKISLILILKITIFCSISRATHTFSENEKQVETKCHSLSFHTLKREEFIHNQALINELKQITLPSYKDPTAMMNRDLNHCNKLYLAREADESLIAFFMVGWEPILFREQLISSVFLGLGVTRQDKKSTGLIRFLFSRFIYDARKWEERHPKKLLLWYTTATPSIFYIFNQMFSDNQPRADGSYDEEGKELALAIRNHMHWPIYSGDHPFVIKGIAKKTRYSTVERERIESIIKAKNFNLFKELEIDETQGDRMLRICRVPNVHSTARL
ncbi:MAG: hypothetical protein IBJ00_00660 [Alphaproteobacteria bacterium]|nr:hypothetical protein [Alphaproteobacteria bacterium]